MKRTMMAEFNERCSRGRQKKRWGDMIQQDMEFLRLKSRSTEESMNRWGDCPGDMIWQDMEFLRLNSRSTEEAMGIHDTTRHGVSQIEVEVDRRSDGDT